jgi:hypothetical protein
MSFFTDLVLGRIRNWNNLYVFVSGSGNAGIIPDLENTTVRAPDKSAIISSVPDP